MFPHPLITEVLFAVPTGDEGDANKDGNRHAAGDEFVELFNPHEKPIQLQGYTLTDRNPPRKGQIRFTFPALELPPGGVAVVFNGNEQAWSNAGPVGDSLRAPAGPSAAFGGGYVFTMRCPTSRMSWANTGDYVLLSDPAGRGVQCVRWGTFAEAVPAAGLREEAPVTSRCSVQRIDVAGPFAPHVELFDGGALFSPGEFRGSARVKAPGRGPKPGASEPANPRPPGGSPIVPPPPGKHPG